MRTVCIGKSETAAATIRNQEIYGPTFHALIIKFEAQKHTHTEREIQPDG